MIERGCPESAFHCWRKVPYLHYQCIYCGLTVSEERRLLIFRQHNIGPAGNLI